MDFINITIIDIVDILVVALIMYYIYKIARGTQAPAILTGILLIYILWIIVRALNMEMLSAILGHIIGVGVIALIVVFQPEVRRFLQVIGIKSRQRRRNSFWARILDFGEDNPGDPEVIEPIKKACTDMAASKTGALIVIKQHGDLSPIAESGIALDAKISSSLLKNIFFKNAPLHDGAVLIEGNRIVAAKCILPSTQSVVPVSFGMRHRAALGMSEVSDAIIIVVSEETGSISISHHGQIKIGVNPSSLSEDLQVIFDEDRARRSAKPEAEKQKA